VLEQRHQLLAVAAHRGIRYFGRRRRNRGAGGSDSSGKDHDGERRERGT
jgi:hypothetical protein